MVDKEVLQLLIPFAIAAGSWIFAIWQWRANREQKRRETVLEQKRKKLDLVQAHLDSYAELIDLYRFFAREESWLTRAEDGQLLRDEQGNYIKERRVMEPEPRFEQAIVSLQEADIKSAIARQIVKIRLNNGKASDILYLFDPSGGFNKRLALIYYKTVDAIEREIERKDIMGMIQALEEADRERRALHTDIDDASEMLLSESKE